jgi:hypothetical protein
VLAMAHGPLWVKLAQIAISRASPGPPRRGCSTKVWTKRMWASSKEI